MTILTLLIGIGLPTLLGCTVLQWCTRKQAVLTRTEYLAYGFPLGMSLFTFVVFIANWLLNIPLQRTSFGVILFALLALTLLGNKRRSFSFARLPIDEGQWTTTQKYTAWILGAWISLKVVSLLLTGLLTPTYFDDALDNWNFRSKVFYQEQSVTLELPGPRGPIVNDINAYPANVPLTKVWIATVHGSWNEPLSYVPNLLWFLSLVVICYKTLRRTTARWWSLLGLYMLTSMPLLLLHSSTAYVDIFFALHLCLAVLPLFLGLRESGATRTSWLHISMIGVALLTFTKNEALVLYIPPLLLVLLLLWKLGHLNNYVVLKFCFSIGLIAIPFVLYKYTNNLNFGNAKDVSALTIGFEPLAVQAILTNVFLEGNWLLLPGMFFVTIAMRWKMIASTPLLVPTLVILMVLLGQCAVFILTPLSTEAIRQTGVARGMLHVIPLAVIVTTILLSSLVRKASH